MTKAFLLPLGLLFLLAIALPAQNNGAGDMAVNRAIMDQANTILLRQKLEDAKSAAARGDLPGAAKLYEDAKTLVDQIGSGIDAEKTQTISGLVASWLELARQAQHAGDLREAGTDVTRALKVDPHNAAALAFKKANDETIVAMNGRMPDVPTLEQVPLVANDKTAAATLVQDGKLLYEMGKFEEAEVKLNQALKLDPDNEGAFYYLNLVKQAFYARQERTRTTELQDKMVQVSKAYSPEVGNRFGEANPYARTNFVHTSPGREIIYNKLDHERVETVSWPDGLPLSEVIRWLNEQSKARDPDKKGINFLFNPNVDAGSSPAAGGAAGSGPVDPTTGLPAAPAAAAAGSGETADPTTITVQMALSDVSFQDVLNAMTLVAKPPIKYSVEDYAVIISAKPSGPEPPTLEMRVFRVDPNTFYEGLMNVSTTTFASANSSGSSGGGGGGGGFGGGGGGGNNGGGGGNNNSSGGGNSGASVPVVNIVGGSSGGGGGRGGGGGGGGRGGGNGNGNNGGGTGGGGAATAAGVGPLNYLNSPAGDKSAINVAVQTFFNAIGVNLTAAGRSVAFNDKLGLLFVKATPGELDTIERTIQVLNQVAPQVHIKARFIEVGQDDSTALGFDWYLGNFINGNVVANGGSAPSLTVPVSGANPLGAFPGNTTASVVPSAATDQSITQGLRDSAPTLATVTGILTDPNFRVVLRALEQRSGFENLAEPEVVTTSGRQTQMRATQVQFIVTGYNTSGGGGGGLGTLGGGGGL